MPCDFFPHSITVSRFSLLFSVGFTDNSDSSSGFSSCSDFKNLPIHPESLKSAQLNQSLGFSNSDSSDTETEGENNHELCEFNPAEEDSSFDDVHEVFQTLDTCIQQLRSMHQSPLITVAKMRKLIVFLYLKVL